MARSKTKSIARAGFADDVGAKRSYKAFTILPSKITASHENNYARAAMYSLAEQLPELAGHPAVEGDRICFTRAEVLGRAASFAEIGQEQAIKVARTSTHAAYVAVGFLRHLAALYLEVTGKLGEAPDMRDGLRCEAVEAPRSPEDQVVAAWRNHAENAERKATTPIDDAWLAKRLTAMQVPREEIARRMGCSKRSVDRKLALLSYPISTQLAVHEGRMTESAAHADASKKGQGNARGPNLGLQRRAMRRRVPDQRPSSSLTPAQIDLLVDVINGDKKVTDDAVDDDVARYVQWLDAPPPPPRSGKKPPPAPAAKG